MEITSWTFLQIVANAALSLVTYYFFQALAKAHKQEILLEKSLVEKRIKLQQANKELRELKEQHPPKTYDLPLKQLESEQGEWFVNHLLEGELLRLLQSYVGGAAEAENGSSSEESGSDEESSSGESFLDGDDEGLLHDSRSDEESDESDDSADDNGTDGGDIDDLGAAGDQDPIPDEKPPVS